MIIWGRPRTGGGHPLILGGALAREFLVLVQEGRQLQRFEVMGEQKFGGGGHSAASAIGAM